MTTSRSRTSSVVTLAIVAALVLVAIGYRDNLIDWFSPGRPEPAAPSPAAAPPPQYSAPGVDALRTALDAYERIRAALAADEIRGVPEAARTLSEALTAAAAATPGLDAALAEAAARANQLTAAVDLAAARKAFAELNAAFVPLVGRDPRVVEGRQVFECPMAEDAQWFQPGEKLENPYMGQRMLACGTSSVWQADDHAEHAAHGGSEILHYTCPMHPSVKQAGPGKCPICGMDLTPVTAQQHREGVVLIDDVRRQLIGVRTAPVIEAPMRRTLRVVGRVTYDESGFTDVNLKVGGWITKLFVEQTGQRVVRGRTLFDLYSPDLYAAQQDLLLARGNEPLVRAARKRLRLLGLSEAQVDQIAGGSEPRDTIAIPSPATGFVIEKNVVEGASVDAGTRLFRIAALDDVWIEGDVYEEDLHLVKVGQAARVSLDYLPGRVYEGKVAYVYPYLASEARTGRVRVELANKKLELRPGMYARIELSSDLGPRLQIPASAVVYTGPRRLVFVDLGEGRFKPQEIEIGIESEGMYEVRAGLRAGDTVATSGVFLIAAEARISTAAKYWDSEPAADGARQ